MQSKSLSFVLSIALAVGVIGCKTNAKSGATAESKQPQTTSPVTANDDNSKSENVTGIEEKEKNENKTVPVSYAANSERPVPQPSSKGVTREVMKNVDFHPDDLLVYRIRTIRGSLLRRYRSTPPVFDDKQSFILKIDSAVIGARMDTLANLMNSYVFAYPGTPLKNFHFNIVGSQLKATGTVHKLVDLPFEITGNLSATPDGQIRIHPTSIKAGGLPVKGFMHLFGVELDDIIKAREARGLKMDDDDLILDPERMGPPPMIRGKVSAVQVVGDEVILIFGGSKILSEAEITRLANSRSGGNYLYYRGGTVRFGKLTMTNADLKIIDANPKDPFDFSIDHYNQQLVAGYSKATPRYGLVARIPDYYKIRKTSPIENPGKTNSKPLVGPRGSNRTSRTNSDPSVGSLRSSASNQTQPQEQKPKKKGLFARLVRLGRRE
jgi:hypothetical protein